MKLVALAVAFLTAVCALPSSASAAPRKILILPVDGTADPATRSKLTARIARLARNLDGQIATAEATFADTALAVGCDPQAPSCSEQVMATLGVDQLVWGTASRDGSLVVRHASKGAPPREASTTIAPGDPADRIDAALSPLFGPTTGEPPPLRPTTPRTPAPSPVAAAPDPATISGAAPASAPATPGPADRRRDRNVGIALVASGGAAVVLGLALLSSYGSLQEAIDEHRTTTRNDFDDLASLESRAQSRAIAGDLLLVAGLAAGGVGAYYLYRDHKRQVAVAPARLGRGFGLALTLTVTLAGGAP